MEKLSLRRSPPRRASRHSTFSSQRMPAKETSVAALVWATLCVAAFIGGCVVAYLHN